MQLRDVLTISFLPQEGLTAHVHLPHKHLGRYIVDDVQCR